MTENIETKVARTILQEAEEITVGDTVYKAAPPSTATLILMSEAAARMPQDKLDPERIVDETLAIAKHCRPIGEFAAILILGVKGLTETRKAVKTVEKTVYEPFLFGLLKRPRVITETVEEEVVIDRKAELSKALLEDLSPRELKNLMARLLSRMQIADFFGLTTFLIETNLLRQTREVGTTASGQ